MYEILGDVFLELDVFFIGVCGVSVWLEVEGIFMCLGEVVRGIFGEFENVI